MQWYSPFRRINSGTRFGHIPAAVRCRRRHLAALPASRPGASAGSASAGGAPALLGASALAGGAPALRGPPLPGVPHARRGLKEKRMVQFGGWSTFFGGWSARVLFGGWCALAVTHVSYLSFLGGWSVTHVSYLSFSADGLRGPHVSFWRLHILADGLHMLCFWRMVCTGHYTNGAHPAPCTLHCLRPDSIPYTLGCPCETSTSKLFGLICGPCHQKGEGLHTGMGQEHNSYLCLPLP